MRSGQESPKHHKAEEDDHTGGKKENKGNSSRRFLSPKKQRRNVRSREIQIAAKLKCHGCFIEGEEARLCASSRAQILLYPWALIYVHNVM
jgi:hypothetical protein